MLRYLIPLLTLMRTKTPLWIKVYVILIMLILILMVRCSF